MVGFAGGCCYSLGQVCVKVKIDDVDARILMNNIENHQLSTTVLIGRDFFDQPHVRTVKEFGVLRIEVNRKYWTPDHKTNMESITREEIDVNNALNTEVQNELVCLLNEHRNCFAKNLNELGLCNSAKMKITLTSDVPVDKRPYKLAFTERERVKNIVLELVELGIVRESTSEYSSPIIW